MVKARSEHSTNTVHDINSGSLGGGYFALQSESRQQDGNSSSVTPQEYSTLHDSSELLTPTIFPGLRGNLENDTQGIVSDFIDASGHMSESSIPDQSKTGSSNSRRRPRLQHGTSQPGSGSRSSQPSQNPNYVVASPSVENPHGQHPSSFHYSAPSVAYDSQGSTYVGQYTMSGQPNPIVISPPPYAAPHAYHYPVGSEMSSMNMHVNYPNMLQSQAPLLPLQRPPLGGSPNSYHSFHGTPSPPIYHTPSPTSPHQPSPGQTPYMGFHSLQYPTPMATPPYHYTTRTYLSSPLYSPQLSPPFGQQYHSPPDVESQGTWFYPPNLSLQHYDGNQYQDPYPSGYSQARQPYTVSPLQPNPSQHSNNQTPSDSPRPSGAGQPSFRGSSRVISSATQSASSNSGPPPASPSDQAMVRRPYHPNPPAHRSEWVMWAGNVPSDASHDELWKFFNQPLPSSTQSLPASPSSSHIQVSGVLSIFLISRSSCAFVNYDTEENLKQAIARFNGMRLRAHDSRCPRLLCRARRKDDDLKAGVGGQRGMGMHKNWVKEQNLKGKGKQRATDVEDSLSEGLDSPISPTSVSDGVAHAITNISISGDVHANHSSSSGSFASTNSSFLAKYFPKRYFILKSLTREDLDLSVARGAWATQKHNEEILDQAYRSSKDVYLIFSVNKSGEFYGYARMSGPVQRGEQRLTWASRPAPAARASSPARITQSISSTPQHLILPPGSHHFVDKSPEPIDNMNPGPASRTVATNLRHSAPALLGEGYCLPSGRTLPERHSLDHRMLTKPGRLSGRFVLDPDAPLRAMRANTGSSGSGSESGSELDKVDFLHTSSLRSVEEEEEKVDELDFDRGDEAAHGDELREPSPLELVGETGIPQDEATGKDEEMWGDAFAVQWITTIRVSFHRTKHLRNPWNHDREIKISRDGTELEPSVGQRLLDEWASLADAQTQMPPEPSSAGKPTIVGKRSTNTNTKS